MEAREQNGPLSQEVARFIATLLSQIKSSQIIEESQYDKLYSYVHRPQDRQVFIKEIQERLSPEEMHRLNTGMLGSYIRNEGIDDFGLYMGDHALMESMLLAEFAMYIGPIEFERDDNSSIISAKIPRIPEPILAHYGRHIADVFEGKADKDVNHDKSMPVSIRAELNMANSITSVLFNNAILQSPNYNKNKQDDVIAVANIAREVAKRDGKYAQDLVKRKVLDVARQAAERIDNNKEYFSELNFRWYSVKEEQLDRGMPGSSSSIFGLMQAFGHIMNNFSYVMTKVADVISQFEPKFGALIEAVARGAARIAQKFSSVVNHNNVSPDGREKQASLYHNVLLQNALDEKSVAEMHEMYPPKQGEVGARDSAVQKKLEFFEEVANKDEINIDGVVLKEAVNLGSKVGETVKDNGAICKKHQNMIMERRSCGGSVIER